MLQLTPYAQDYQIMFTYFHFIRVLEVTLFLSSYQDLSFLLELTSLTSVFPLYALLE